MSTIRYKRFAYFGGFGAALGVSRFESDTALRFDSLHEPGRILFRAIDRERQRIVWVAYSSFERVENGQVLLNSQLNESGSLTQGSLPLAARWCTSHLGLLPEVLKQDLARHRIARENANPVRRRKARSDTRPVARDDEKPAAPPVAGIESTQTNQPRAAARRDGRQTERRVEEELRNNPSANSDDIAKAIGDISPGRVRNTAAWKNREAIKQRPEQRSVREIRLTDEMLAVRDSGASDPAEIVAEQEERYGQERDSESDEPIEVTKRKYIEGASSQEKARFHAMNATDKEHELTSWKITGMRGV
jgi:hypothetical protein